MRTSSETHKADALCDLSRKTHTRAHTHGRTYSFSHTHSSSRSRCFVPPIQQDTHTHAHKNTQSSSSTRCAIHASTSAIAPHSRWHSFRPCAQFQPPLLGAAHAHESVRKLKGQWIVCVCVCVCVQKINDTVRSRSLREATFKKLIKITILVREGVWGLIYEFEGTREGPAGN